MLPFSGLQLSAAVQLMSQKDLIKGNTQLCTCPLNSCKEALEFVWRKPKELLQIT